MACYKNQYVIFVTPLVSSTVYTLVKMNHVMISNKMMVRSHSGSLKEGRRRRKRRKPILAIWQLSGSVLSRCFHGTRSLADHRRWMVHCIRWYVDSTNSMIGSRIKISCYYTTSVKQSELDLPQAIALICKAVGKNSYRYNRSGGSRVERPIVNVWIGVIVTLFSGWSTVSMETPWENNFSAIKSASRCMQCDRE